MVSAVRIKGLRELDRAFAVADKAEQRGLRLALRESAEPVKHDAEHLARENISRIGEPWSEMKIGATATRVYVAPREKGRLSRQNPALKRPKFKELMLGRSLEPALERNRGEVLEGIGHMLDTVGRVWESV